MAREIYDDSPNRAQVPLTAEEVDDLLLTDGSFFAREPRRVRHLLTRMRAAFAHHVDRQRDLQRDIEHMHAAARNRATPMAAALEALRQLSLDEQRQLFDIRAQALIDAVETARSDAERARTAASSEANRVKFALSRVMGDPHVPAEVKSRLEDSLNLVLGVGDIPSDPQPLPEVAGGFTTTGAGPSLSDALFGDVTS